MSVTAEKWDFNSDAVDLGTKEEQNFTDSPPRQVRENSFSMKICVSEEAKRS